ncbi:MAG TPA: hypothetical protein VN493_22640 [Thermoanaerobaculia bacterium]|nr:hypothetical protein [Thermoanaerobaculia bacterium]
MPRVPVPLAWKRRSFAVLEPEGMIDRRTAVAVTGLVAGPFAVYAWPVGSSFKLIHLPSQAKILDMEMQHTAKHAAEEFAVLDVNWWTCISEEVIGPDLQEMRNVWARLKGQSWVPWPNVKPLEE